MWLGKCIRHRLFRLTNVTLFLPALTFSNFNTFFVCLFVFLCLSFCLLLFSCFFDCHKFPPEKSESTISICEKKTTSVLYDFASYIFILQKFLLESRFFFLTFILCNTSAGKMVLENKTHWSQKPEELCVLSIWKSTNKNTVLYREEHLLVCSGF